MNTEHATADAHAERGKSRRFWIILGIAVILVLGLAYNVQRDISAENQQHNQNVRDYTCAISGRDC